MKEDDNGWSLEDSIMEGWQCTIWVCMTLFLAPSLDFGYEGVGLCSVGGTALKKVNNSELMPTMVEKKYCRGILATY